MSLPPPYNHHLSAAVGWIELGNPYEALGELNQIPPEYRTHPVSLETEWHICAAMKYWQRGAELAQMHIEAAPENPTGWLHQAYAIRRMEGGSIQGAWDALLPAYTKFPNEPTIPYNLACYACQMGKMDECRDWLQRARKLLGKTRFKEMALSDPDLKPLWDEIRDL